MRRHCRCRSEEHTSELQSPCNLVCRLLLENNNPPLAPAATADPPLTPPANAADTACAVACWPVPRSSAGAGHPRPPSGSCVFFFFNAPATTEIYTLSLHDALPICLLDPVVPETVAVLARVAETVGKRGADGSAGVNGPAVRVVRSHQIGRAHV